MQAEVNEEQTEIEDIARRVTDNQPAEEVLYDLAELFKVFGDSTRIRILYACKSHDRRSCADSWNGTVGGKPSA